MIDPATDLPPSLVWSDGSEPGLRRRRAGRGFAYVRPDGTKASRPDVERIKALAIPPAWTDVWICTDPCGRLQATGRDAKGRKQYRYHARYRAQRDAVKYGHLVDSGAALADIRRHVAHGRAKHGRDTDVVVTDRRLRHLVKQCQDLPGQVLFQYLDDAGDPHPVSSADVNDYLRAVAGLPVTAKDFRTWMGTLLATCELVSYPTPSSEAQARSDVAHALDQVSAQLGNTRAVCRASYVHPRVVGWFRDGTLPDRWQRAPARGPRPLVPEERKLLALLRAAERRRAARAA